MSRQKIVTGKKCQDKIRSKMSVGGTRYDTYRRFTNLASTNIVTAKVSRRRENIERNMSRQKCHDTMQRQNRTELSPYNMTANMPRQPCHGKYGHQQNVKAKHIATGLSLQQMGRQTRHGRHVGQAVARTDVFMNLGSPSTVTANNIT